MQLSWMIDDVLYFIFIIKIVVYLRYNFIYSEYKDANEHENLGTKANWMKSCLFPYNMHFTSIFFTISILIPQNTSVEN